MALHGTRNPWIETPLIESANLSKAAGCRILLKLEILQPSGSFKSRGLGYLIQRRALAAGNTTITNNNHEPHSSTNGPSPITSAATPPPKRIHIFTSSGGNAGLAAVHAANLYALPSTVVVPTSTKPHMLAKLRAAGARDVIQVGATWKDADRHLREVVMPSVAEGRQSNGCNGVGEGRGGDGGAVEAVYVPPFDHPDIWEGHSYMVDEIAAELGRWGKRGGVPSAVVCSVGGGGLFNGVKMGVDRQGWGKKTQVIAMNTVGADALAESLKRDEHVMLPGITSIATSLGAVQVAEKTFEMARKGRKDGSVVSAVLTDAEAAMGCWRLADDERLLVEPACGVSIALCYDGRLQRVLGRKVNKDEIVVIVVCGGSNVSTSIMEAWRQEYGIPKAKTNGHAGYSDDVPSAVAGGN